jgi:hypothetical protein
MVFNEVCNVCAVKMNKLTRKKTQCEKCDFVACSSCMEKYFSSGGLIAQCMQCHNPWEHNYLLSKLGNASVKRILKHQKDVLFAEQKTMFPHTQQYVILRRERIVLSKDVSRLNEKIKADIKKVQVFQEDAMELDRKRMFKSASIIKKEIELCKNGIVSNKRELNLKHIEIGRTYRTINKSEHNVKPKYMCPCYKEDCHGYVKQCNGFCELCDTEYCKKCMNQKTDTHICLENDVLTVDMLKKDTKPCPKCSVMIHRISGCPDMFCVECNTAFNWNTLKINIKGNTNPHYYEWIDSRDMSRTIEDARVSEGYVDIDTVMYYTNDYDTSLRKSILYAIRSIHHAVEYRMNEVRKYNLRLNRDETRDFETITRQERVSFMMNDINDTTFKISIMRLSKGIEFNIKIDQLHDMLEEYHQKMKLSAINISFELQKWLDEYVHMCMIVNKAYIHLRKIYYADKISYGALTTSTDLCVTIPIHVKNSCVNFESILTQYT